MVKKDDSSKTLWEALGDDLVPEWYPARGEGEISPPEALQEVLEPIDLASLPGLEPDQKKAVWRPDLVRERRKLKQQLEWARKKAKMKAKGGRPRKYKTHWQRKNARRDWKFNEYQKFCSKDPWTKYQYVWMCNGIKDIRITPEEFNSLIESQGGLMKIEKVRLYKRIASLETIVLEGRDGIVLYRGTAVPEEFPKSRGPRGPYKKKPSI